MRSATAKACAMTWVMMITPMPRARDPLDHLEAAPGLLDAERGEGLVEEDELAAPVDEAVELDRLALAAGEMLDIDAERRDVGAAGGERLGGFGLHLLLAEDGDAEHLPRQLAAHEEIGGDVDIGAEREVLVDGLDAGRLGLGRRGEDMVAAFEDEPARWSARGRRR